MTRLMLGRLQMVAAKLARERNLTGGYRTVINTGGDAGQSVAHLHRTYWEEDPCAGPRLMP